MIEMRTALREKLNELIQEEHWISGAMELNSIGFRVAKKSHPTPM